MRRKKGVCACDLALFEAVWKEPDKSAECYQRQSRLVKDDVQKVDSVCNGIYFDS